MYSTNEKELLARIQTIIRTLAQGKAAVFARKVGLDVRNTQRNLQTAKGYWFMNYIQEICDAYPTISEAWIYEGTGSMFVPERINPIRSTTNKQNHLIGDLLWEYFRTNNISIDYVFDECGFSETFPQVMESSRYPTFTELEILYEKFDLNPYYLITGNSEDTNLHSLKQKNKELRLENKELNVENKKLNEELISTYKENSELNKELRSIMANHNSEKTRNVAFGQIAVENLPKS